MKHESNNTLATFSVNGLTCIRQQRILFSNISFEVNPGEGLIIAGSNGAGKSSLLRLLTGIATQYHYIAHAQGLKLKLSIKENLILQRLYLSEKYSPNTNTILSDLNLASLLNTPISQLSAGQRQKISLMKLFLYPRKIWLLDEPLTSLDAITQAYFFEKLKAHLNQHGMVIMSSHQPLMLSSKFKTLTLC